jgi:hypothetical protein
MNLILAIILIITAYLIGDHMGRRDQVKQSMLWVLNFFKAKSYEYNEKLEFAETYKKESDAQKEETLKYKTLIEFFEKEIQNTEKVIVDTDFGRKS